MSMPLANAKATNQVNFIVKHTFIEVQGAQTEQETESPRRKSDIGPIRSAQVFESVSGFHTPSTDEGDDSDEEDSNPTAVRLVSFAASVDSDDIIGAPLHSAASIAWQTVESDFVHPRTEMNDVESPWAPCSSLDSSCSSGSVDMSPVHPMDTWQPARFLSTTSPVQQLGYSCNTEGLHSFPLDMVEERNHTTVMVRNLPINLSQTEFVKELNGRGYRGLFDFVYMPMNFRSDGNFGYAFVNFTSVAVALQLMNQLQLLELDENEWRAVWSTCQGTIENVERYRNSPLMHETVPADYKPALYDSRGIRVQFPPPTKNIPKPRIHYSKNKLAAKEHACKDSAAGEAEEMYGTEAQQRPGRSKKNHKGRPPMAKSSVNGVANTMGYWSKGGPSPR